MIDWAAYYSVRIATYVLFLPDPRVLIPVSFCLDRSSFLRNFYIQNAGHEFNSIYNHPQTLYLPISRSFSQFFFRNVLNTDSCLHSLLPTPRPTAVTSRLRSSQTFPKVHTRTQRYCSFIQYGLNHYQHKTNKS